MSKAITAVVCLLVVAFVCVFVQRLLVMLAVLLAGNVVRRRFLRYAAPGLLVLLVPALLWATFGTSFQGVVTVLSTGSIVLNSSNDVALDSLGNIYIADTNNNQIVEVTAAGVASVLAFPGISPAMQPQAVAVDGAGNVYVADGTHSRVVELSGGVASVLDTGGLLSYPDGVVLDASGNLYIADAVNNDIVEVPAGGAAAVLAITGLGTPLNGPGNVAVDVSGNLYIADAGNNRIVEVTTGAVGSVLSITGGVTLSVPLGVAVDGLGNVYIADRNDNRIVTVTPAGVGNVLSTGSTTLRFPRGLGVDFPGTVYIADNNGGSRIVEVQPTTVGFGHLPVGSVTGTTLTLPFTVGFGVTLSSVQVLTLGTPSLDFTAVVPARRLRIGVRERRMPRKHLHSRIDGPGLRRGRYVSAHRPGIAPWRGGAFRQQHAARPNSYGADLWNRRCPGGVALSQYRHRDQRRRPDSCGSV